MCVGRGQSCVATRQTMWSIWGWITVQNMMELCSSRRQGVAKVRHNTFGTKHYSWTGDWKKRVATGNVYQCHGLWERDSCLSVLLFTCWCSNYSSFHIPQTMDHLVKFLVENHIMLTSAVSVWVWLVMGRNLLVSLGLHLINQNVQVCLLVWLFHWSSDRSSQSPQDQYMYFSLVVGSSISP